MSRKIIDIESNGLFATTVDYSSFPYKIREDAKLWCIVILDKDTGEVDKAANGEITREWLENALSDCHELIAHNGLKFDFLQLQLFGIFDYHISSSESTLYGKPCKFTDTLLYSRLLNPDRHLGHSLHQWGIRTGQGKIDFRQLCIDKGYIDRTSSQGSEFLQFSEEMVEYCVGDCLTTAKTLDMLLEEKGDHNWDMAIHQETVLAHLAIRRENFGFWFDKDLAIKCVKDLTEKMETIRTKIDALLPERALNKTEINNFVPPKTQIKKDGTIAKSLENFAQRMEAELLQEESTWYFLYKGRKLQVPLPEEPLQTHTKASIDNLDHVKMYLIQLGWSPTEWRERDLTKDAKKQNIPYAKRLSALQRWFDDTVGGKYTKERLEIVGLPRTKIIPSLSLRLREDKPVRVPTSPVLRVGVEKELCSNLESLGEKVEFAKDLALYLTYKHRKSSIAGGDIEDMDFDVETPNTGFLSMYREVDGRVATPAIEIGAASCRYRHVGIVNVPRASSIYGKEMRNLFGCGTGFLQLGFDFSSLENRIQGHFVSKYEGGEELAKMLIAEKPNDLHSVNALKLGISRTDAKSLTYAVLYGAQPNKISKMLNCSLDRAKEIFEDFWNAVPALKSLKEKLEQFWESTDKKYILSIDGRKIFTRSKHSLLNFLFQSSGVICTKYTTITLMNKFEKLGYCIDAFKGKPDIGIMISMHDEEALAINPEFAKFKTFETEGEAKKFVSEWEGDQLSTICHGKKIYVALPNIVSKTITESIKEVSDKMKLRVELGHEYAIHTNWFGTH